MSKLNYRQNFTTRLAKVPADQFRILFESAPVPLVEGVWGKSFEVLNINPAAMELFAASSKEEFTAGFNAILTKVPSKVLLELLSARVRGDVFESELRLLTFKRTIIYVFMRLAYIASAGPQHTILSFQDITEYKRRENILKRLSQIDWLTQGLNQRAILERLEREMLLAKRYHLTLSCVLLDLDNFKNVNDTFGHLCGDRVLKNAAQLLKQCFRKTDIIGRLGGDEFLLILPETAPEQAVIPINRFFQAYEAEAEIKNKHKSIVTSFSAGISGFPASGMDSAKTLLAAADKALYKSKSSGGHCCHVYDKQL